MVKSNNIPFNFLKAKDMGCELSNEVELIEYEPLSGKPPISKTYNNIHLAWDPDQHVSLSTLPILLRPYLKE